MKKALGIISIITLSLFSLAAFLLGTSTFASYYIDALGFMYHSDGVVRDVCIFLSIVSILFVALIIIIVKAIRAKDGRIALFFGVASGVAIVSFFSFIFGLGLIIANGTNGCSYTEDIANYGKYDKELKFDHFPDEITDDMTVIKYAYYYKYVDSSHYDIYLEVKFDDAQAMEKYLETAKEAFSENGIITYQNPYDPKYTDIIMNTQRILSRDGAFASEIEFEGAVDRKCVDMIYSSITYSYEDLTIIYNDTCISDDITLGNDPDKAEYYPQFLEHFGVEWSPDNNFSYELNAE